MQRTFEQQLQELLQRVLVMGSAVETMIQRAVGSLLARDESMTAAVFEKEKEVDVLQVAVDELAVRLTALHQPMAQDARFLFMASRIGGELERMGDLAINICQNLHHVLACRPGLPQADIPRMADLAQKMVRDSLGAMNLRDLLLANTVLEDEKKLDAFRDEIFRALLSYMSGNPSDVEPALSLILISRNLERIGDHATNIAEEVIYWIAGRDVRHGKGI